MSDTITEETRLLLHPADPELAEWFLEDLGGEKSKSGYEALFGDNRLLIHVSSPNTQEPREPGEVDLRVGLLRFVDVLTLQSMEETLRNVSEKSNVPVAMLIYRNENELDFKMSCPYCGQKLWVRDADQDKRGRCPHCRKGFTLPAQEEHVTSSLRLKNKVPVYRVVRNDAGTLGAPLRSILEMKGSLGKLDNLEIKAGVASNQTMNVDIEDS